MTVEKPGPSAKPSGGSSFLSALAILVPLAALAGAVAIGDKPTPTTLLTPALNSARLPAGTLTPPANSLIQWDEETQPGITTYAIDGLVLSLQGREGPYGRIPVLTVSTGGRVLEVLGSVAGTRASAQIGVGKIDPASPASQVLFTTFSGGAHCCAGVQLVELLNGAWKTTEIGAEDGDRLAEFPKDLDGDGQREVQLTDDSFLYAFASYAESRAPPLIVTVKAGQTKDVSAEPRFRPVFQAYLATVEPECRAHSNGACPAYAAAAARLGKLDEAWPVVLQSYDATADWMLPTACQVDDANTACPEESQVAFDTYPEALRWFLGHTGYAQAVYIAPQDATGPSFLCEAVTSENLRLICATPELAKADRHLAAAYNRAMAFSSDPAATRAQESEFIKVRNAAPSDVFVLLRLYQAQIGTLEDQP